MPSSRNAIGAVVSLWRYPVKSMMGEDLNAADIHAGGLAGDRAFALIDRADAKIATAKNPRKWPTLFDFRAALANGPAAAGKPPSVRITLPDGAIVNSDQPDVHGVLSAALRRDVMLAAAASYGQASTAEEYWPDIDGLDHRDTVTGFALPEGTFFDAAVVHLLTTSTIDRLRELYPHGRFEVRRFRPNIVVQMVKDQAEFVENAWVGRVLAIGEEVRLNITGPCARCVMTTLAQGDLPKDDGILRTAAKHNAANVGVYASVVQGGRVRRGDAVVIQG
jgi:uncharacterized protein YcbX